MSSSPLANLDGATPNWIPIEPQNIAETGLTDAFLQDLALKILYFRGQLIGSNIAREMHLPFQTVLAPVMDFLKREQMCEVKGAGGLGQASYMYSLTDKGAARAREQLERSAYIGPAPVPWDDYVDAINEQGSQRLSVTPNIMARALSHMILSESVFSKIGPAVNSGKSIFLYGPPGNGKTSIAESIGRMVLTQDMYIPFAIEVDGQIVQLYDEINHERADEGAELTTTGTLLNSSGMRIDPRWVRIHRPVIMVGGELTLDGLELIYDRTNKYYEAPYQMKANGGLFLIDDFGRQQVRPRDLLNRWIVPMEKRVDFLSLHTGRKLEVPFEVLIVFSTNLPPRDLVDEAFLRRIRHKIEVTSPSFDAYREIFKAVCQRRSIEYNEQGVRYLLQEYYIKRKQKLRANHPRDLVEQMLDIADYLGVPPRLTKDLLDRAAESYFVEL